MKSLFFALALFVGTQAQAATIAVEFTGCAASPNNICAIVYGARGPEEMGVQADPQVGQQIANLLGRFQRTLAMNIEGKIVTVNGFGDKSYRQLQVYSLNADPNAPRPR